MLIVKTVIEIFAIELGVIILDRFFCIFFTKKKTNGIIIITWCIYTGWQILASGINQMPSHINILMAIILTILISLVSYEGGTFKKCIFSVSFNTIAMLVETLCGYIFITLNIDIVTHHLVGALISKLIVFLVIFFLGIVFIESGVRELPKKYSMLLMFVPVGSILVINTTFRLSNVQNSITDSQWSFASSVIMLVINIIIFTVYIRLAEELEIKRCNTVYEQQLEQCNKHMREKETAMMEFRNAKHDMKQKVFILLEMAEEKKNDEMIVYLNTLLDKNNFERLGISRTGNMVVDSLINYKYAVAAKEGIGFIVDLQVPTQLQVQSADLCVIVGNALDNALEATRNLKCGEKYIRLFMKYDKHNLSIVIVNSYDGYIRKDAKGELQTRKSDRENHGIGVRSIRRTVCKYNGSAVLEYTDTEFTLKLLLYTSQEKLPKTS